MRTGALVTWLAAGLAACAPPLASPSSPAPPAPAAGASATSVPDRAGTLRTDQITVELEDGPVLVRLTPLDEEVIRLTAPDAYRRLRAVAETQRRTAGSHPDPGEAALFLVSFQSGEADRPFDPTALVLEVGGQRRGAVRITPLSPGWGQQRLRSRTPEVAVYAFPGPVPPFQPFVVVYGTRASDAWRGVIPLLEAERTRVR